jgi:hypothetical protein
MENNIQVICSNIQTEGSGLVDANSQSKGYCIKKRHCGDFHMALFILVFA